MKKGLLILPLVSMFALSGCDFIDGLFGPTEVDVEKVVLEEADVSIEINETYQIKASVTPKNAKQGLYYVSDDTDIASVSKSGLVKGLSVGETTIRVTSSYDTTKSAVLNLNVAERETPPLPDDENHGFYGGLVDDGNYIGYEFSKSQSDIVKPTSGVGEINILSFNDFHGSVIEQETSNGYEVGIKKFASLIKEKSDDANTLVLDQGDTWQGSFESNYGHGAIVQDVFNYAGVSLRTVGNHDFDWGLSVLEETNNREINGEYIPCLASNVFNYSNGHNGSIQQNQYGKEYAIFTLDNGIKVGVVGVIGDSQITSICSNLVDTICFTDHIAKVKEISDYLRISKGCDVIIASAHEGSVTIKDSGLSEISSASHKRYADLVLGGHKHYEQEYTVDGVKYVQWDSNGVSAGNITLKYDFSSGQLIDNNTSVSTYDTDDFTSLSVDTTISQMVDDYLDDINEVGSEIVSSHFSGNFDDAALGRLMCEAIYKTVSPSVDLGICNYARQGFSGSTLTFRDLYKCFPFDNQIVLVNVNSNRGIEAIQTYSGVYSYKKDSTITIEQGETYKCAIIDYLAFHVSTYRSYNYFPDVSNGYTIYKDDHENALTYRDILYSYLKNNDSKTFRASDYSSTNDNFIK